MFLDVTFDSLGFDLENVESNSLGEGSALSDGDNVSFSDSWECWRAVSGEVLVSLFESVILGDVMEVVSSDDNGSLHLGRNDDSPIIIIIINKTKRRRILKSQIFKTLLEIFTYLKILPLMETSEVNGHFLSTYYPSIASAGVLNPIRCKVSLPLMRLTKTNLLVVSDSCRSFLGQEFFGVEEHIVLLLESSFVL